jgi:hypothetical protein
MDNAAVERVEALRPNHGPDSEQASVVAPWVASEYRLPPLRRMEPGYPTKAHHLGRGPKHYRRSKTGRMLADYPELDSAPKTTVGYARRKSPRARTMSACFGA